jgi:glutamate synthase domain-containing protein 3
MVEIDCKDLTIREINTRIKQSAETEDNIVLLNPGARHNLAVGVTKPVRITIEGSAGYFCGGLVDGPTIHVKHNAGWGTADNLISGRFIIDQNAGPVIAVAMRGGGVHVKGNMGSRAGQVMKDGHIVCEGSAGYRAGSMMMGGTIIILGDGREAVGDFMMDGRVFVAGQIDSLGEDAKEAEYNDDDRAHVADILGEYGLPSDMNFRKVISGQRMLHYQDYERSEGDVRRASVGATDEELSGNRDPMEFDSD